MKKWLSKEYRKAQAAAALAIPVVVAALSDGHVSGAEWIEIVAAVLIPPAVASVTNVKDGS